MERKRRRQAKDKEGCNVNDQEALNPLLVEGRGQVGDRDGSPHTPGLLLPRVDDHALWHQAGPSPRGDTRMRIVRQGP